MGIWQLSSLREPAAVSAARWCHQGVSTAAAAAGAARGGLCEMEGEGKGTRGENPSICKKKNKKKYRQGYSLSVKLNGLEGGS